jgi:hypothetical protein
VAYIAGGGVPRHESVVYSAVFHFPAERVIR